MKTIQILKTTLAGIAAVAAVTFAIPRIAAAHCDTLDGPVIQDAHKALAAKEITPVLKWVKAKDEKTVKAAFKKALAAKGAQAEAAHNTFFATLVKIHRAGEGAPFTGLKPAGAVEPAVAEADKALASGSADALVKLVTDDITAGIKQRYARTVAAYRHKDESVALGREFVEAYVEFTHYVEKLHREATGKGAHGHDEHTEQTRQHSGHAGHGADKH
jgi:hypothetical protein